MGDDIEGYGAAVLNQIDQLYPNYDWSPWDQRINEPGFQTDNSGAGRDGKLDYVLICFRTGSCSKQAGALPPSTGLANVPRFPSYHTFPATANRRAYTVSTGHMQTGMALETLTFLHEFSHTLYTAPHMWGVNRGTTGQYWNQTYGWGMMANINTFYSTNAWERWFLGWTELRTGPGQDDSDIQDAASLAATGGGYILRDFVTTGDVIRIRLPYTLSDGVLGPRIGTREVGFQYGLDSNPVIIPHQAYDQANEKLSQIPLNGLSVGITDYDAATGDLKIEVRYDNTLISRSTRWTGDLKTYPVAHATGGSEVYVGPGATLTLDRSGTAQRQHPGPGADFVNDTRLTVSTGTRLATAARGNLELRGQGTTLYVDDNASVAVGSGGTLLAATGTTISVQYRSDLQDNSQLVLKVGSRLIIRSTGQIIPGTQRPFPVPVPNPAAAGTVALAWEPGTPPATAAGFRYELQDLQGQSLRRGACQASSLELPGIAPGVYLLVLTAPEGERRMRRVEVR